jgi:soluble lytic murein transglycosylase-like protein
MATITDLQNYAAQMANTYGINPAVFAWQIGQESGWNPNAQNGNATGIAQFMPATAKQYGVNPNDPYSSIAGAAKYDSVLLAQNGGDYTKALTSYGTLAGVPQSVKDAFNSVLGGSGVTGSPTSTGGASSSFGGSTIDSWFTRGAIALLALIILAGAIYTYKG